MRLDSWDTWTATVLAQEREWLAIGTGSLDDLDDLALVHEGSRVELFAKTHERLGPCSYGIGEQGGRDGDVMFRSLVFDAFEDWEVAARDLSGQVLGSLDVGHCLVAVAKDESFDRTGEMDIRHGV